MNKQNPIHVGIIGFGEAGNAFASGWKRDGIAVSLSAFDITPDRSLQPTRRDALANAAAVFSLVTADQAFSAMEQSVSDIPAGAVVFDCNSCAPDTKKQTAALLENARYVDVAIMAPVHPNLHQTPLLISGPHAKEAQPVLNALGMNASVIEGDIGAASSVKMIRSIMIKGLEALTMECVLAGHKAGVDKAVLDSLDQSFPGFDWAARATYMMERMTTHGIRRAAEMREVVKTIEQLGLPADMAKATVDWQQRIGDLALINPTPDQLTRILSDSY